MTVETIALPYIEVSQHGGRFYLVNMPASLAVDISYASVRGKDREAGAVQRVLNNRRISKIRDFARSGGTFPNSIVMNWVKEDYMTIDNKSQKLIIQPEKNSAQLIDGQHRVAGLAEAMSGEEPMADIELPVAIFVGLTTKECADIFLAINTEQKPVHRSLVFDLYAIADDRIIDASAARVRDIALELNDEDGPYYGMIKFPGEAPRKGGVALSTVVSVVKPLIEPNGVFDQVSLSTLENQSRAISNFFFCLKDAYGELWFDRQNAFMFAAGFAGAMEFLANRMVPYCVTNKSFAVSTMRDALRLDRDSLVYQKDVSGRSGSEAQKYIFNALDDMFDKGDAADEYDF